MLTNPYQQYKEQSLSTLTQGEILVKLYDEMIKQLTIAKLKIAQGDLVTANNSLTKCQTILMTLDGALDMRYPISSELHDMYLFLNQHIVDANIRKNAEFVQDCIPLIRDLRDSFEQADKLSRKSMASVSSRASIGGRAV